MVSEHPISDEKINSEFPVYVSDLEARLRKAAGDYGDSSFLNSGIASCKELALETIDISGWGFILWARIKYLEKRIAELEALYAEALRRSSP